MDVLKIFRVIGEEFKDVPDEDIVDEEGKVKMYGLKTYIELWKDQISQKRFGSSYEKALAYLVAHKLKMMGYGEVSASGQVADALRVASYSEGETSISFHSGANLSTDPDGEYAMTIYGLEFLRLKRNAIIPIVSAGEGPPHA